MPLTPPELPSNLPTRGDRIRWARERLKLTQEQLGTRMGKDQTTVGKWENNKAVPRNLELLAQELDIPSPAWLAFGVSTIDDLSADTLDFAVQLEKLPEDQQALLRQMLEQMARSK